MSDVYDFKDLTIQYSNTSFSLNHPTSESTGAFTFSSSNELVATISGNIVTITGIGSTILQSFQEAEGNYSSNTQTMNLIVTLIDTELSNFNNIIKTYSDDTFPLIQPTSNNTNGLFSYTSSDETIAEIYENVVKIVGIGQVIIRATQESSGYYNSAWIECNLTVNKTDTILTNFNDVTYLLSSEEIIIDEPSSNNSISPFIYNSSNSNVFQIIGNTIKPINTGNAVLTASQDLNEFYNYAFIECDVTITSSTDPELTNFNIPEKTYGDSPFDLIDPQSKSNGNFTFTSLNNTISISGRAVTILKAGLAEITATQSSTDIYSSSEITTIFIINQFQPILSNFVIPEKTFGDSTFDLSYPLTDSDGEFTFTSSHNEVATIVGRRVTINGTGKTNITCSQSATSNYLFAEITAELNVIQATTILSEFSIPEKIFGDNSFELNIPKSNRDGAFIYSSLDENVASIVGNKVTVVGAGKTTITAKQTATPNYLLAEITAELNVIKATTILNNFNIPDKIFGNDDFDLTDPESNRLGNFTYSSSDPLVATVYGKTVRIIGEGYADITATQVLTSDYFEQSIITKLNVSKAPTTLTRDNFIDLTKTFGDTIFGLFAPVSNRSGALTYSSSDETVATISGSTVTIVGASPTSIVITATQAAVNNYFGASITCYLTVNQAPTTLTRDNFIDITKTFGDVPFYLMAPTSNRTDAFTYTSSDETVATISGNTVTIIGARSDPIVITATQASTNNYLEKTITCSLTVNQAIPLLSSFNNLIKTFGDTPFNLIAPTSSNISGAFTYSSSDTSVATISGNTVTIVGASSVPIVITALQASTDNYLEKTITCSLTVNKATPLLSNFLNLSKSFGDKFDLTAPTSASDGTFTYTSSILSVATISRTTVTIVGVGTAIITATQLSTNNYFSATISLTLTTVKAVPVFNFPLTLTKTFGDLEFNVTATSNSPMAITYSSLSISTASIGVSTGTVKILKAGSVTLKAIQATNMNYLAGEASCSLTINKATTILSNFSDLTIPFGNIFTLTKPTSNYNGFVSYTSSIISVATVHSTLGSITHRSIGETEITANQAEATNYTAANIKLTLTIIKGTPILNGFANVVKTFGNPSFTLTKPTSKSTGAFRYISLNTSVATVNNTTGAVIIKIPGETIITATQLATSTYFEATTQLTLYVNKALPTFVGFTNIIKTFGNSPFGLTPPTSNSNGTFSYTSSDTSVATILGSTVTILRASPNPIYITALQASTDNYLEASTQITLTVNKAPVILNNFLNLNKKFGETFVLTDPTSISPGEFTYSSSNVNIATIVDKNVTVVGVGQVTITAIQTDTSNYLSATIMCSLTANQADPIISNFNNLTKTFKDVPFDLIAPTSNSNGSFTYSSSDLSVATVSGSTVTIVGARSEPIDITATQAATANYKSGSITCSFIVNKAVPVLSNFNSQTKMIYDDDFLLNYPSSTSPGSISFISSNSNVASVSGNLVSINDGGYTTILARQEATNNYEPASITCGITILKRPTILSNFVNLEKTFGNNDFTLSYPTSNREGNYSYVSSNPQVAIITNNIVKIVGGGSTIITAIQSETAEYAEERINCVLTIFKINPKLINIDNTYENNEYQIKYESTSDGTFSYTFSDNSAVKINPNNTLTFLKKATVIVTIHQEETVNYFKGTFSTIIDHNE